jgi:PAS domain S-box-containing protein
MSFGDIYGFFTGTLRGRLILSVAVVHAVMMTLFIVDLTIRQRSLILEHQLEDAAGLSQSLAVSAAGWIVARDISGLQELVEAQRRYPELIFAIVADETGQILAHTDKTRTGQYLIDLTDEIRLTVNSKTPALTDVAAPAMLGGKFVGWSRIGIGQKTAAKKLDEITTVGALYALIAIIAGSLIAWSMGLRITRRLYTVENTISEVKAGNNSARCAIAGTDEAAMLAKEFNAMLDALAERETALEKAGENLKEAQRLASIGSWNWDALTDVITWSEEYYRIYGFDPSRRPPGYQEHLKAYTPESAARLDAAVKKNMQTGEAYELDLELAGAEPRRWITARSETVRNARGEIKGLRGTAQDITERKRAEQKLAFLSFALNSVCEAAFLIDEKARFHFVNEEACRILGYTREQLLEMGVPDVDPDFPEERWPDHWRMLRAKRSITFEGRHIKKDGLIFPVEISANYIEYENQCFNLALMRDITERKAAEKQILKLNRIYAVLSNINQAIIRIREKEELLNEACRIAVEYGGFHMAWVGMANFQTGKVDVAASNGATCEYLNNIDINLNDGLKSFGPTGTAIRTATHNISNNIRNDEKMAPWRDKALKYGYSSSAAFPLTVSGKSIGAFNIYSNETDFFDEEDIALLDEMAKDISFALEFIEIESDSRRNHAINESRLRLMQFAASHSTDELLEETLNEVEKLTGSLIGFYHFVDDDQNNLTLMNWSARTKSEFCRAAGKGSHYPIADAGVWIDCVHQRKPVIHNDYASLPNRRGMPEGHAVVARELVVPVLRGTKIKAILGVGNAPCDYTARDIEAVSLLADLSWEIAERKMSEEAVRKHYSTLRGIIDNTDALIFSLDGQYRYTSFNRGHADVMRAIYGAEIEIGRSLLEYMSVAEDRDTARYNLDKALAGESLTEESYSGDELRNRLYFQVSHSPIKSETGEIIGVAVFSHDITERKTAEERLITSLKEKEVLLRELYHRTKNNMQVICSMLELYSMDFDDETVKNVFSELNNKIRTMALVHQKLYKSQNLSCIGMKEYIRELVELLMKSYRASPQRISPEYDLDDIFFAIDLAIPCGLLVNELISNALKHAFPGSRQGRIEVRLKKKEGEYVELLVSDDGIGAPQGFDFTSGGKMGLQTVFALGGHQLQGKIEFESSGGVTCRVTFKNKPVTDRTNI